MTRARSLRILAVAGLVSGLLGAGSPATAALRATATKVVAHAVPATVHLGAVVVVSGTIAPKTAGAASVQRLVGKTWRTVGHAKVSAHGAYTMSLRAPKTAAVWALRVTRPSAKGVKAGVSATFKLHVVKAIYVVTAVTSPTTTTDAAIVVTGKVSPKGTGTIWLQRLQGRVWVNLASTKLTRTSTYTVRAARPVGSYRLRVVKAFSSKVAGGTSHVAAVTVTAPPAVPTGPAVPAGPVVTTTALPAGTVSLPYSATLLATGGTAPYAWTVLSGVLPAGLALSAGGVFSGTPTTVAASNFTVAAVDAGSRVGSAAVSIVVAPSPFAGNTVKAWGVNALGGLGNGTMSSPVNIPVGVSGLTGVVSVAGGYRSGYAVTYTGDLWSWGGNDVGELGNNTSAASAIPVQVTTLSHVTAVAGGAETTLALEADGTVWAWGSGTNGALGNGLLSGMSKFPVQVPGLTGITAIAENTDTGYALRSDGTVMAWGDNSYGGLGDGTTTSRASAALVPGVAGATAIATGAHTGYALVAGGAVLAWGLGTSGELGNGAHASSPTPVMVSGITGATSISAGSDSGYAVVAGTVRAWGLNNSGQLGDNTTTYEPGPITMIGITSATAVASQLGTVYVLTSAGTVYAAGNGLNGEVGNGAFTGSQVLVPVSGLTKVTAIAAGADAGYAVISG